MCGIQLANNRWDGFGGCSSYVWVEFSVVRTNVVRTGSEGVSLVDLTEGRDPPFLDVFEEFVEHESVGSDSTMEVSSPQPYQKTLPAKWGPRCRFNTFVSRPDLTPVCKPKTRSSGSPSVLALPT